MTEEQLSKLPQKLRDTYNYYCITENLKGLSMDSIILTQKNKKQVDKFLTELENAERFYEYGLTNINKVLSYGASGTGKTFLAKCIAAQYGLELITVDIANIISAGEAYKELVSVFDLARYIKHSIIFLDECDAIARERGELNNDPKIRQLINGLFKLIDSMDKTNICMAATNLEEQLDKAFVRRFDLKLEFDRPDVGFIDNAIEKFINPKFEYIKDADSKIREALMQAVRKYTGLSYAEIEIWVQRAEKEAILRNQFTFRQSEVYSFLMYTMGYELHTNELGDYLYQIGKQ